MKPLDQHTLIQLHKRMIRLAEIKKHVSPEDIAAEYVVRLLEGYHAKATVEQAYIDICRLTSGRKGQPGYDAKNRLNMLAISDEQNDSADLQPNPLEGLSQDEIIDLKNQLSRIKCERTKKVFAHLLMGYSLLEIGELLDLSMARIQQIVSSEVQYLKETC